VLKERIAQLDEAVRQAAAGLLPFALVPDLCNQLKAQIGIEERATQIKSGKALLHDARSELKKKLCSESLFSDIPSISQKQRQN